jgi:hypothetical protein
VTANRPDARSFWPRVTAGIGLAYQAGEAADDDDEAGMA